MLQTNIVKNPVSEAITMSLIHEVLPQGRCCSSCFNKDLLRAGATAVLTTLRLLLLLTVASAQTVSKDTEQITSLIHQYEKSVSNADTNLASEIWSQTDDVSFIHPLGHAHGWDEIKRNVYEKLMGELFSGRKLTASDISIHIYKDAAWAEFNWVFVATLRSNGSSVKTEGRETQVYHRTSRGWRLVHVHYSGPPARKPDAT